METELSVSPDAFVPQSANQSAASDASTAPTPAGDSAPGGDEPSAAAPIHPEPNSGPEAAADDPEEPAFDPSVFDPVHPLVRPCLVARGFDSLTAVQRAVLETEAEGRDLQISSQTGSGKTVALGFVLAAALAEVDPDPRGPQALIIVPTRELATQVRIELCWLLAKLDGHRPEAVTGGTPIHRDRYLLERIPRVLVGTPGRLLDHIRNRALDLSGVRELVLDEADQMLDMGFREELEGILDATPEERRTHLVSATFPDAIRRLAQRYQREPVVIEGTRLGDANQDIEHVGHLVDQRERYAALVNLLLQLQGERTLIFVERRSDAAEVAQKLEADGFAALPLSGELVQRQRERTLEAFRAGRVTVLVATDVAARGLDVPDVGTVIHTAPPIDAQVYTHRSGRTGRAGKRGRSILFASRNRQRRVARLLSDAGVELEWKPVPSAAEVRALLAERDHHELVTSVQETLDRGFNEEQLNQAAELLEGRAPHQVVAALLAKLAPTHRTQPMDVTPQYAPPRQSVKGHPRDRGYNRERGFQKQRGNDRGFERREPRFSEGPGHSERTNYQDRNPRFARDRGNQYGDRPYSGRDEGHDGRHGRQGGFARHGQDGPSVRFFMNRGTNQGATPSRILAAVCRRGQVDGSSIGSIAIHPNASTFDVSGHAAEHFEHNASRNDPRDPQFIIRRDRGPKPGGGKPYRR